MQTNYEPVVGNWYVNDAGQLIKVRLLSFEHSMPISVLIEFLDGSTSIVDIADWSCMELNRHANRRRNMHFTH